MTPDELMAYRRAEDVKAAAVDNDHVPIEIPPSEHPETANDRRLAEARAERSPTTRTRRARNFARQFDGHGERTQHRHARSVERLFSRQAEI